MFHWGRIVCRPLQEKASKNEHPKFGAFWIADASNMGCEYSMRAVCKISRCGKKEGEGRKKEEERTAALVMEASLTGLGGQGLAWSHLRSAS